ncbi:MAG: hypothetical protein K6E67_11290 [Prevotella sp.]|nr:hypothetical protein [Prevotella sp.]
MLRWYFTFQTFIGNTCRVEIDDRNYSGSAVELNKDVTGSPGCPSDNPVVIEEDNSNDMLQAVRTKTGYLHLIELTQDGLRAMFPETGTQMSVRITLNSQLIFYGYIQSQTFESKYKSYRRKVDIPIVSAIGAVLDEPMSDTAWGSPTGLCKLGYVFEDEFSFYTYLVMPDFGVRDDASQIVHPLDVEVPCNILSPANDDFHFGVRDIDQNPVEQYSIMTHGEFLEAFCRLYGVTCHEVGDAIVFTRPDYSGKYIRMDIAELYNPYDTQVEIGDNTDETTLNTIFDFADNKGKSYGVSPLCQLRISPETIDEEEKADFTQATYATFDPNRKLAVLHNMNVDLYLNPNYYTEQASPQAGVYTRLVGNGNSEMVQMRFSGSEDIDLAKFGFYTPKFNNFNHFIMKLENYTAGMQLKISVLSGGKYYNFEEEGDPWTTTETKSTVTVDGNGEMSWWALTNGQYTEVSVYSVGGTQVIEAFITEAKMCRLYDETGRDVVSEYTSQVSRDLLVKGDTESPEKASVTSQFLYRASAYSDYPRYLYMTKQQRGLKLTMRPKNTFNMLNLYIEMIGVYGDADTYRMLSVGNEVISDTYTFQIATFNT